jgi:hypothetical protein
MPIWRDVDARDRASRWSCVIDGPVDSSRCEAAGAVWPLAAELITRFWSGGYLRTPASNPAIGVMRGRRGLACTAR